jgi:hypothetical protein
MNLSQKMEAQPKSWSLASRVFVKKWLADNPGDRIDLAMPLVRFVFFAVVFPLQFPLLNLSTRDRHNACCQALEPLKRSFLFCWLRMFHYLNNNSRRRQCKTNRFSGQMAHSSFHARVAHVRNMKARVKEAPSM